MPNINDYSQSYPAYEREQIVQFRASKHSDIADTTL